MQQKHPSQAHVQTACTHSTPVSCPEHTAKLTCHVVLKGVIVISVQTCSKNEYTHSESSMHDLIA